MGGLPKRRRLGEILVDGGVIDRSQLDEALNLQSERPDRLGVILRDLGYCTADDITRALAEQHSIEMVDIDGLDIAPEVIEAVPWDFARQHHIVPIDMSAGILTAVTSDPMDLYAADSLRMLLSCDVCHKLATEGAVARALDRYYPTTMKSAQPPVAVPTSVRSRRKPLGQVLLESGLITEEQLGEALNRQAKQGGALGQVLMSLGHVKEGDIPRALARQAGMEVIDLDGLSIDGKVIGMIPESVARIYRVVPVKHEAGALTVAMADPLNITALDDLRFLLSCTVIGAVSNEAAVQRALERYYPLESDAAPAGTPQPRRVAGKDPLIGAELASCRVVERLGRGGMGVVYRAEHTVLKKTVAIKVIHDDLLAERKYVDRFLQEARSAARLDHPNVVQILHADETEGMHFIVMQFVDGEDLGTIIDRDGPVDPAEAIRVACGVARALSAAHELGIVHRDIKSDNVMIAGDGTVKVMDFGLARDLVASTRITATGSIWGSPLYMSPEQFRSVDVDARSDLYSLGVTLYEMLCGEPPFTSANEWAVGRMVETEDPESLCVLVPGLPGEVGALVNKLLAKDPDDRYQTAAELLAELQALRELVAFARPRPGSSKGRRRPDTDTPPTALMEGAPKDGPAVEVNELLTNATARRASEIHIVGSPEGYRVSFRIDGVLHEQAAFDRKTGRRILDRLKSMASVKLEERFGPQDGSFQISLRGSKVSVRASLVPSLHGETCVLRVVDTAQRILSLDHLRLGADTVGKLRAAVGARRGLIVITGPPGSGKTTTLYSLLMAAKAPGRAIYTVEEPIEQAIPGLRQVSVNYKRGMDPAASLRSVVRHGPDVVMMGVVPDPETLEILLRFSVGKLALTEFLAATVKEALTALRESGADRRMLAPGLRFIGAQALVRLLCSACRRPVVVPARKLVEAGFAREGARDATLFEPVGCEDCIGGYLGRELIMEVMPVTPTIREMIAADASPSEVKAVAVNEGMITLRRCGIAEAFVGKTSLDEVLANTVADV